MQPMSASDIPVVLSGGITDVKTADDLLRDGAADLIGVGRSIFKDPGWAKGIPYNKKQKRTWLCQVLFSGTPGWIRTSGLPLRRRPLYPTELRGHNSAILAQRTAGVNDRRLGNGTMRRGRGAVARGGKSWYDKQTVQRR